MKNNYRIFRLLAGVATVFILMYSLATAADKVVYLPIIGSVGISQYKIGDTGPAGGKVFWVSSNGQHGLEAAPANRSIGIRWYNGAYTNTEAHGDGVGAGEMNTTLIIANQGSDSNSYAAGYCANLVITNAGVDYGDWYLPSKEELNILYLQKDVVGGFTTGGYWSSTEFTNNYGWWQSFSTGGQGNSFKDYTHKVRAIREF